jgi:hypothetical protein
MTSIASFDDMSVASSVCAYVHPVGTVMPKPDRFTRATVPFCPTHPSLIASHLGGGGGGGGGGGTTTGGGGGGAGGGGWWQPAERTTTPRTAMRFFIDLGMEALKRENVIVSDG